MFVLCRVIKLFLLADTLLCIWKQMTCESIMAKGEIAYNENFYFCQYVFNSVFLQSIIADTFVRSCSRRHLKVLWQMEKLLIMWITRFVKMLQLLLVIILSFEFIFNIWRAVFLVVCCILFVCWKGRKFDIHHFDTSKLKTLLRNKSNYGIIWICKN